MKGHCAGRRWCVAALGALLLVGGCTTTALGLPTADLDTLRLARAAGATPFAVGEFRLDTAKPPALDVAISLRGSRVVSPIDGSFARYLRETLLVELGAAGLLDPSATTVLSGFLTDSQADAGIGRGSGSLAARFIVRRSDRIVYERELRVAAQWDSSFVGAVAIPQARDEYAALYRKLVGQLLADPAFRKAIKGVDAAEPRQKDADL